MSVVDAMSSAWRHETVRTLASMDAEAAEARRRVATGLKVSSARDNGGIYALAVGIRSDEAGARARIDALDRVSSILDVALAGTQAISDLLVEMRGLAIALADESLDAASAAKKQASYLALYDQTLTMVDAAAFAEVNLLDGSITSFSSIALGQNITGYDLDAALSGGAGSDLGGVLPPGFGGVAPPNPDGSGTAAEFLTLVGDIDTLIEGIGTIGAGLGTFAETADIQAAYLQELSDSFATGRGNLIDADLEVEAARMRSLELRRELAAQFVPIASRSSEVILRLFNLA